MEALGVEGNLIAIDAVETSAAMQMADIKIIVPQTRSLKYIPAIREIVKKYKVGLIVPMTDLDLRSLARHRQDFVELGCEVMIGPEPTVSLCRDKKRFTSRLKRAKMPAIRTFSLEQFRQNPFYPCFVKPFRGSGGLGAIKIDNGQELRKHVHIFGNQLLIQDYVPGREYTIDVYRMRSGEVKCIVPRQRLLVRSGEVEKGITVKDDMLIEATLKLAELMDGLWGVFCCQCRRPDDGPPYFFELNARFGGGSPLSIAAGADLPLYLLQEVLGREVTTEVGQFTENLMIMRYCGDTFCKVEDPTKLSGYTTPFFK